MSILNIYQSRRLFINPILASIFYVFYLNEFLKASNEVYGFNVNHSDAEQLTHKEIMNFGNFAPLLSMVFGVLVQEVCKRCNLKPKTVLAATIISDVINFGSLFNMYFFSQPGKDSHLINGNTIFYCNSKTDYKIIASLKYPAIENSRFFSVNTAAGQQIVEENIEVFYNKRLGCIVYRSCAVSDKRPAWLQDEDNEIYDADPQENNNFNTILSETGDKFSAISNPQIPVKLVNTDQDYVYNAINKRTGESYGHYSYQGIKVERSL